MSELKLIWRPEVFLVGVQAVKEDELRRFLASRGAEGWTTDAPSAAETLVEVAGRACYLSYKSPRPGGNAAYVGHILESRHGSVTEHAVFNLILAGISRSLCFHPDTEILTREGWAPIASVGEGDVLLTKDPVTGLCRWSKNREMVVMQHDDQVHWFENSEWSSPRITPDHLVWASPYDIRRNRDLSCREIMDRNAKKIPFREVAGRRFVVDHAIAMETARDPGRVRVGGRSYEAEDFFRWIGWVCTDGGISKNRNCCYITQTKCDRREQIEGLLDRLFPGRWKSSPVNNGNVRYMVFDAAIKKFLVSKFGRLKRDRRLVWLFGYSRRLIGAFLDSAIAADGNVHRDSGHRVIYCNYAAMAGDYQVLAAMMGMSACVRVSSPAGRSHRLGDNVAVSSMPERVVSIHKGSASLVWKKHQKSCHYQGLVFCPRTDDGLVYVRRHGHGVWSGNSHELIRHRAGWGYSQLSQRFVDSSDVAFVVPPALVSRGREWTAWAGESREHWSSRDPHPGRVETFDRWVRGRLDDLEEYEALTAELAEDFSDLAEKTARRKAAREAARSVLPNATETLVFATGNVRAIRHMCEQRGALAADAEFRRLVVAVVGVMKQEAPNLFGDVNVVHGADGGDAVTVHYSKV